MTFNLKSACNTGLKSTAFAARKLLCLGVLVCIANAGLVHADLINGGFENPDTGPLPSAVFMHQSLVPGWKTNAASELIEIWSSGFNGVSAYEGKQHAELNSDQASILFQDISGIAAGLNVGFEFAHRARVGTDVMRLTITDLGSDNMTGGGNDTVLFTNQYSATTLNWIFNTSVGDPSIIALGNDVRFAYEAVSTGSGDLTQGNFIDAARFGTSLAVPEPSAVACLGLVALGVCFRSRHRSEPTRLSQENKHPGQHSCFELKPIFGNPSNEI